MKTIIKNTFLAIGAVAMLTGCNENSWNDNLDGFEVPGIDTKGSTVEYTMTDADYTKIAGNKPYTTYAASVDKTAELAAIGSDFAFASEAEAFEYIPLFLRDSTNTFYAMPNGSSVKATYNVTANSSPEVLAINKGVKQYTVSESDYQAVWGSDDDYVNAFAPMTPASKNIPSVLSEAFPDAASGDYAVVTYNEASENPVFGTVGGGDTPEIPSWEPTSVIGSVALDNEVEIKGWVTAINSRGFILTDASGSILCYQASGFDIESVAIGNQITLNGTVGSYNKGFQIAITGDNYVIDGTSEYNYPAPTHYTGAMLDDAITRTDNELAKFISITGKASVSGNYYNFDVEGATTAKGSGYMVPNNIREQIADGEEYTITGYFITVSSGKYANIVITGVTSAKNPAKVVSRAPAAEVVTVVKNAIYVYDGSKWTVPAKTVVLQNSDYTAMGQGYGNLSGTLPVELLPTYLKNAYPYAAAEDAVIVAYKYYGGGATSYRATQFVFNGSEWSINRGVTTSQFSKDGGFWFFNPSVEITLPYSRNTDPSYAYYMQCLYWVFDNIGKPLGGTSITDSPFIDYRGNAEFYSGTSAFYGNVDVRATTAKNNAPEGYTGYDGLSDDEITALVKKRFCLETMRYALEVMHADAVPVDGLEVTYTIHFTAYTGAAEEETIVYSVTGPGQFKYKSCTWYEKGEDADWE